MCIFNKLPQDFVSTEGQGQACSAGPGWGAAGGRDAEGEEGERSCVVGAETDGGCRMRLEEGEKDFREAQRRMGIDVSRRRTIARSSLDMKVLWV